MYVPLILKDESGAGRTEFSGSGVVLPQKKGIVVCCGSLLLPFLRSRFKSGPALLQSETCIRIFTETEFDMRGCVLADFIEFREIPFAAKGALDAQASLFNSYPHLRLIWSSIGPALRSESKRFASIHDDCGVAIERYAI